MAKTYNEEAIQQISGIDWILMRPENHIQVTNRYGQFHVIKEVLDNSMDETEQLNSPGGIISIFMFLDKVNNTYQTAIIDDGRGIPHGALVRSCTELFNSGKYDNSKDAAYKATGGLNGIGLKVAMALSENFRVIVARDGYLSSVYVHRAELDKLIYEENVPCNPNIHGTMVVLEPRKGYFTEVEEFIETGYEQLIKLCYLLSMFSRKTTIVFRIVEGSISNRFWKLEVDKALNFIDRNYEHKSTIVANGANNEVAMMYLKELWQLPESEKFQWELTDIIHPLEDKIGYAISLYLPKILRNTCATTIVNNMPIHDLNSSHITTLVNVIKNKLVSYIEKPEYVDYFLSIYKLPICCAISIKYTDIKFTGLAKSGFRDAKFELEYGKMLEEEFNKVLDIEWQNLYELIAKDIETKYAVYYNKPLTKRTNKSSLDIIEPVYYDCETSDRSQAELYIVEGISASHITNARDPETQALLMIYGKPKNVFKTGNSQITPQQIFDNYEIYQRLERILNIHSKQEDLSSAAFSKIILMNDADIDGGHIQALHIGGLYTLNPRIITSGMVYIANPPLYEVTIDEKRGKYKYIQDKNALIRFFIECLYRNTFDIAVMDGRAFKEPTLLDRDSFTDFCYIVTELGELFYNLSNRLAVPPFVLEQLSHITQYIRPGHIDGRSLVEALGKGCSYDKYTDILTIIGKKKDYSFAVEGICDALYEELLGYLHKLCWKKLQIYVTTKYTDALKNTRVSLTQLYEMFLTLNKQLEVTRQKGLGGMDEKDLAPLCMRKDTRVLHQITSLGDFERIRDLLGDDVKARKAILREHGLEVD